MVRPTSRSSGALGVVGLLGLLWAGPALAQSAGLLGAVRLHKPGARAQAEGELAACAKAGCAEHGRLSLLAGVLQLADGDPASAQATLAGARPPAQLVPWHRYYQAQAAFYTRDYAEAARHLAAIQEGAPASLRPKVVARLGEALLAAGDPAAALPHLEAAAAAQPTPELLHQRAQARAQTRNAAGAKADWALLAVRHPQHPYGEAAAQKLAALKPPHRFTFEERLRRAGAFADVGRAARALEELETIDRQKLARGATAQAKLAYARANALFAQGKDEEAEQWRRRALKGPASLAAQAAMLEARRALKKGDRAAAYEKMLALAQKHPREGVAEEALYLAGWLDLQEGRFEASVKTFELYEKRFPGSRRLDDSLWFKALALLRLEQHEKVQAALEGLQRRFPRSSLVPQAKYWRTRAAQLSGEKGEKLLSGYSEVISLFPGSFYALLSQLRLSELGQTPSPAFPVRPTLVEQKAPPELAAAVALSGAGLFTDARAEVSAQLSTVRGAAAALQWGKALAELGEFGAAYQLAARHLWAEAYSDKKAEAVGLLYPRAYRDAVERAAADQKIPVWLVWAIMRRESAFRPEVSSPADARGLMQLIPPTATAIARQLGDEAPPPDSLYAPEVNIRYGAWYLAKLKERFAHPALIAAAYNAGPPAVAQWAQQQKELPLDLFVELIPYKETRGYVKQVVADYSLYQALYGDPARAEAVRLKLPEPGTEGVNF